MSGGPPVSEHADVVIVGAGLSGVGLAHHLQEAFPGKRYVILEGREAIGGTWDLFRYPGVRSDSDMFTLGYRFRPWTGDKAITDGPSVLRYVRETAAEAGIDRHIRFGHRVRRAEWSGETAQWTVTAENDAGTVTLTCGFLAMCSGYYRYDQGYQAELPGLEKFSGQVVHPQFWPDDLDYAGKRVVVVGSGATAVTIVPAMAETAEHVTMLQRSPSYVVSLPSEDVIARLLARLLGKRRAYAASRWKNALQGTVVYELSQRRPHLMRKFLRSMAVRQLPAGYDVDTHFNPSYNPWDQRMCIVPDGDLFRVIKDGHASVATGRIATFTENGVRLESGEELDADVVVTATGLQLIAFGGAELAVDGQPVALPETMAYKGMMLSGIPNFAFTVGYTNASWTLKADLVSAFVCRLLRHMDNRGYDVAVPVNEDPGMARRPLLDFTAGYVLRSIGEFPRAGDRAPWRLGMSYFHDYFTLRHRPVNDGVMRFSRLARPAGITAAGAAAGATANGAGANGAGASLAGAAPATNLGKIAH